MWHDWASSRTWLIVAKIRKRGFWIRGNGSGPLLWDYLLLFGGKPPKPCLHRPTTNPQRRRSNCQFNHGSRKTGQAAGAGGKQDRYVHICDIRLRICGLRLYICLSLSGFRLLTPARIQAGRAQCGERLFANRNPRTHRTTRSSRVR